MKLFTNSLIKLFATTCLVLSGCASIGATNPTKQVFAEFDNTRVVRITSEIGANSTSIANQIIQLATQDTKKDINLLLTSPGGLILGGNLILQAMESAQARGVHLNCIVPVYAASMAFSVFHHCNSRYAFPRALLLFHPSRTGVNGYISGKDAQEIADEIIPLDLELLHDLESMGLSRKEIEEAYFKEKHWTARELAEKAKPGYIILLQDIRGIPNLFEVE